MLFAVAAVCIASVPLAGGRLARFADLRFRRSPVLLAALALQFANYRVAPAHAHLAHQGVYLVSYGLGGVFLWANRRVPGLWLVGLGALSNAVVIAANGGLMPGAPGAFSAAGLQAAPHRFVNSRALAHPRLLPLGDVFAVPSWLPFHNVFSIGDLCIVLGAFVALHRISRSRLLPSGSGQFEVLAEERQFRRLWLAQAVSNQGDWVYSAAVVASLARHGATAGTLAALVVMQAAPRALASTFGGPLVDRLSRRRLMVCADWVRAVAVLSLLVGHQSIAHLYAVAVVLGVFAALFQPSLQASIPNVVPESRLMAANALVSVTFQLAIMTGPVLGAILVARLGLAPAFLVDGASFIVSAVLVGTIRLPSTPRQGEELSPMRALAEGARYAAATPIIRGIFLVTGMVMFAAAIRGPLEPLFLVHVLHSPAAALGLPAAVWGLGMLLGSSAAPAAARSWSSERLLTASVALVGIGVLAAAQSRGLSSLLFLWLAAGSGNAVGTIAYQTLLQQRTPDALRGRIIAASEAVLDIAYLAGVTLAGWLGGHVSLRAAMTVAGAVFLAAAAISRLVVGRGRHHPAVERPEPSKPPAAALVADRPARPLVVRFTGPAPRPRPVDGVPATQGALVSPEQAAEPAEVEPVRPYEPVEVRLERMAEVIAHLRRLEAELVAG